MTTINILPSADTFINSYGATTNYGTSTGMSVGMLHHLFAADELKELLMRFDIMSYIPANSIISSAKLFMYPTAASGGVNTYKIANIANRTWTETGVTWNNQPPHDDTYPNKTFTEDSNQTWITGIDITSYVKDMYSQGITAEFEIHFNSGNGGFTTYSTKESATNKPYLQVTYSPAVTATSITATPTSCTEPCDDVISVTWKNNDTVSHTFIPGITVDGTLYTGTATTLAPGATYTDSFNVTGLISGSHAICPVPN